MTLGTDTAETRARYFVPGPAWVAPEVLAAMVRPVAPHRSPAIRGLWRSSGERLQRVFRTGRPVLVATSSATLVLEAALVSLGPERLLSVTNGAFSERWLAIARSRGLAPERYEVPWGRAVDPEGLAKAVDRTQPEVVTLVHCETSTGVLNPVAELARVVRERSDALVLVDCVSSLAGAPVETEAWGLDLAVTASQKALALPPGLALFSASERFEKRAEAQPVRGFYTDVLRYRDKHRDDGPISTPALPQLYALDHQLDRILDEGLERRWRRHRTMLEATRAWAGGAGFEYASDPAVASPTVSCLVPPPELDLDEWLARVSAAGFTVARGYGRFQEGTFRIGHMGDVGIEDLNRLLAALTEAAGA